MVRARGTPSAIEHTHAHMPLVIRRNVSELAQRRLKYGYNTVETRLVNSDKLDDGLESSIMCRQACAFNYNDNDVDVVLVFYWSICSFCR